MRSESIIVANEDFSPKKNPIQLNYLAVRSVLSCHIIVPEIIFLRALFSIP